MKKNIVKPSILPGFMELLPADQILFNKMKDTIRDNYEKCGFIPLDTPVIEKAEVLLAKGGGETEKQIYEFTKGGTDMALRFDLTVPLARYVSQHMPDITFPFRRYQIGKVYRGERSQKGRYREFYQCDIDIIGNGSLSIINDAEIPSIIYSTFKDLGFKSFTIHINNRKILNGFFNYLGIDNKADVLRIIDKIDKIGAESVKEELHKIGVEDEAISKIMEFIAIKGSNDDILLNLNKLGISSSEFELGLEELSKTVHYIRTFGVPEENFVIDLKIARGLDYYTGTVYETFLNDHPEIGSVCSGGRYDNLAEYYTKQKLPGVGISIGLTRLFSQLKETGILGDLMNLPSTMTEVLVVPMDEDCVDYSISVAGKLRNSKIVSEVYMENVKLKKKLNYANKLGIPYVIIIGEEEVNSNMLTLKEMSTGEQSKLSVDEVVEKLMNK